MSYQVLARKWRPTTFAEVVGQQHVLQALSNALDNQRLHHAFLFTGTRGVGKTTIARILAKCLNCEKGVSSTPCGECSSCLEIAQGRFVDLIEVDAASRTKVEDTRELLDNVQYAPTRGRYKVYLIDEVHMLSGHSFNALLKTLEEPPPHVVFLLATTDPQKLPITVLSRCLQFHLKNMPPEQIASHLADVLNKETIEFDASALTMLGKAADGSMRDGLSLLDQAIAFSNGKLTQALVREMLGAIEQNHIYDIVTCLSQQDAPGTLAKASELNSQGADFQQVLDDLLSLLQEIAISQHVPDNPTDFDPAEVRELAQTISAQDLQLFYQIALLGKKDLPLAPTAKQGFEMILLRMLAFQPKANEPQQVRKPVSTKAQPVQPASTQATAQPKPVPTAAFSAAPQPTPKAEPQAVATTSTGDCPSLNWAEVLPRLGLTGITQTLASHCVLNQQAGNHIELQLDSAQGPMLSDIHQQRIAKALEKALNQSVKLTITIGEKDLPSPANQAKQQQNQRQSTAEAAIEGDDKVQAILEEFGGIIHADSIKPINSNESQH
ncbi:MAG: DNA polymerase III subunit gamma/tau [Legionellales bacterium]|nr:DNA polymerase III subunit gamma/tau [Legionellales bacterium]|tara:strand:- start:23596 stop:25251 length:1656 start_codon:yes stop_codon:yes gene_type:complete